MAGKRYDKQAWSTRKYRAARAAVLAASDICGICGHPGASSTDHIIPLSRWPRLPDGTLLPGHDSEANLAPAHGTTGAGGLPNPCLTCGKVCNQTKGNAVRQPMPRSRVW